MEAVYANTDTARGKKIARSKFSARSAMISVVIAAMTLLTMVAAFNVYDDWTTAKGSDFKKVLSLAEYCAERQQARTMASEILLRSIASSQSAANPDKTPFIDYLRSIDSIHPGYIKFLLLRTDGTAVSAQGDLANTGDTQPEKVSDGFFFKEILKKKKFVVGEHLNLPGFSQESIMPMGLPLFDEERHLIAVLAAVFDLGSNEESFRALFENYDSEVLFFDRHKRLAYRYPPRPGSIIGNHVRSKELETAMRDPGDRKNFMGKDIFNDDRLFALVKLRQPLDEDPYLYVVTNTPRPSIIQFLTTEYREQLGATVLAFIISLWLASGAGRHFFSRGLEIMAIKTRAIKYGDFSGRIGAVPGCREIQILAENMNAMLDSVEQSNKKLRELSQTDELTRLCNRRHFYELAEVEIRRALRGKHDLAIIMADLDRFKNVNDTYGHGAGDAVIRSFANILREGIRTSDLAVRFGGEEFIIMLPETGHEGALNVAEKLRLACVENIVEFGGKTIHYTVSLGIFIFEASGHAGHEAEDIGGYLDEIIRRADDALYISKENGRNRSTMLSDHKQAATCPPA